MNPTASIYLSGVAREPDMILLVVIRLLTRISSGYLTRNLKNGII